MFLNTPSNLVFKKTIHAAPMVAAETGDTYPMKQKYLILKNEDKNELVIKEFAELDKEMMSLLCEETYEISTLQAAFEQDKEALVKALRTHNMYPPGVYAEQIAEAVIALFAPDANPSAELFFEDKDLFVVEEEETPEAAADDSGEEAVDVDGLLKTKDPKDNKTEEDKAKA